MRKDNSLFLCRNGLTGAGGGRKKPPRPGERKLSPRAGAADVFRYSSL
ncbi:hypothetical protein GCWU000341_02141 [Oribacterium sp. oral taxon 078 str. F0262]|nr:hypothetical protein GCWU000341_02141 [Oribacterium sp. oral taxon 078 str. F0262]